MELELRQKINNMHDVIFRQYQEGTITFGEMIDKTVNLERKFDNVIELNKTIGNNKPNRDYLKIVKE